MSVLPALRRLARGLSRRARPSGPPLAFGERLDAAIARDPGLRLRVSALERSLAENPREPRRAGSRSL